jgi:hypothetical protein
MESLQIVSLNNLKEKNKVEKKEEKGKKNEK